MFYAAIFYVANFRLKTLVLCRIFYCFFEDGVSLLVGGDDAGELLDVGVSVGRESDFADGVGAGVVEDVVLDVAGTLVGGEA